MSLMRGLKVILLAVSVVFTSLASAENSDYTIGPGDTVRISVFEHPDLATEARVSETGAISFPLVGEVKVGGLSASSAEAIVARKLVSGGFVKSPQVNVLVVQYRSQQVSVLGEVNRPGRYPLESRGSIAELIATAGGVNSSGGEVVYLISNRNGVSTKEVVDIRADLDTGLGFNTVAVENGDILYVPRASVFYVYGEVQRPGVFRLERDMTVLQALSVAGGLSARGTENGMVIKRKDSNGKFVKRSAKLDDEVKPNDVVVVDEGLF